MRATARALAVLACAAGCVACAPLARLPYRPDQPPTVSLPAVRVGVGDARAAFAALFEDELREDGRQAGEGAARWLHGVDAANALPAAEASRLRASFAARASATAVLIVPGLFGDCVSAQSVPFGDGELRTPERSVVEAYRQYDDLGLRSVRMVPLPGRASSASNGRLLADAILTEAGRPGVARIVVIAYSKGLPDLLHAMDLLQADGGLPRSLDAVVSVAGAVMGTPLADFYESVYDVVSPLVSPLDCTAQRPGDLASLTRRERIAWLTAHPLAAGPSYYSVVAHAPLDELAPPLRWAARQLAAVDPRNDGQILAADAVLPGSTLLAEARADHWDVALPRDRHPDALWRSLTSGRSYPREALFRALLKWVVGGRP